VIRICTGMGRLSSFFPISDGCLVSGLSTCVATGMGYVPYTAAHIAPLTGCP
jgi:hypothetical protein